MDHKGDSLVLQHPLHVEIARTIHVPDTAEELYHIFSCLIDALQWLWLNHFNRDTYLVIKHIHWIEMCKKQLNLLALLTVSILVRYSYEVQSVWLTGCLEKKEKTHLSSTSTAQETRKHLLDQHPLCRDRQCSRDLSTATVWNRQNRHADAWTRTVTLLGLLKHSTGIVEVICVSHAVQYNVTYNVTTGSWHGEREWTPAHAPDCSVNESLSAQESVKAAWNIPLLYCTTLTNYSVSNSWQSHLMGQRHLCKPMSNSKAYQLKINSLKTRLLELIDTSLFWSLTKW